MVGRPKIFRTPEEIKALQKLRRKQNKEYYAKYHQYYYLKKILADPDYNKKNWARRNSRNNKLKSEQQ